MPGLTEGQILMSHLKKEFSERQSDREEVDLFREKHTPQSVGHLRRREQPGNMVWLVFRGWVIS